ncbi:MAG TPA: class I SAM-dependent methyltransferase [Opitutaceae bacterium]
MKWIYASEAPSEQQTLDLFKGQWASKIPTRSETTSGGALLFEDPRVGWALDRLNERGVSIDNAHVLELGPLEGAHTKALANRGAASVTAVEASSEAYLKCLVVKETLGLERVNFLYGDATKFLQTTDRRFKLGFACGVLYHLVSPVQFIAGLARCCDSAYLWTQCWDTEFVSRLPKRRGSSFQAEVEGFRHTLHRNDYGNIEALPQFWGGSAGYSQWMQPEEIIGACKHFGFRTVEFEQSHNTWGAVLQLVAVK